ncbi:MAG: hypothetical protein VX681_15520 [Myxococcota bacterium]|nr:hypothetical protein [Myxococcota bacterium]
MSTTWSRHLALGLIALAIAVGCGDARDAERASTADATPSCPDCTWRPQPAWSAQLHLHGSWSEGIGSFSSHAHEAAAVGADVIWWSDHDFRITGYRRIDHFDFEHPEQPAAQGETWRAVSPADGRLKKTLRTNRRAHPNGRQAFVPGGADRSASLALELTSQSEDFEEHIVELSVTRNLYRRSLATGVRIVLSVAPDSLVSDTGAVLEIHLSEHPIAGELRRLRLRYLLGLEGGEPKRQGTTLVVPLALTDGGWNELVLPVSADVRAGFPELDGADNSLNELALGVQSRQGATARFRFDDLEIQQTHSGRDAFARYGEMVAAADQRTPGLVQLEGLEISGIGHHLNQFGGAPLVIDYEQALLRAQGDGPIVTDADWNTVRNRFAHWAVEQVHQRGGLVSLNHMFGAMLPGASVRVDREPAEVLAVLLEHEVFGADLLEVGYRDRGGRGLADHLEIWDELARRGFLLVGTGVSDSHGGPLARWATFPNNLLTWIYADSPTIDELVEGLRAGAAYFGDILLYDGRLDLVSERGGRMGQVVVGDRPEARIWILLDALEPGDIVRVVESDGTVTPFVAHGPAFRMSHDLRLDTPSTFARVEVTTPAGRAKILSNPIYFVRSLPARGLPGERVVIDLGGVRSRGLRAFHVTDARLASDDTGARRLEISGHGRGGRIELESPRDASFSSVELAGLTGHWDAQAERLALTALEGSGRIVIHLADRSPSTGDP